MNGRDRVPLDADGRFESPLLSSGSHSIGASRYGVGTCHLLTVDLLPGETRSVGDLVLPGLGTLVVALHPHADVDPFRVDLLAYRAGVPNQVVASNGANLGGDWTVEGLPEGEYRVYPSGGGVAVVEKRFTIRAGETTLVDLDLHPGNPVRLDLRGERLQGSEVEVRDEAGELVGTRVHNAGYGQECSLRLRPGRYEVIVTTPAGRTGSARVEVPTESTREQVVPVEIR